MYESIGQAGLKLIMYLSLASNLQESSCLSLPIARIIGMFHHIWLFYLNKILLIIMMSQCL